MRDSQQLIRPGLSGSSRGFSMIELLIVVSVLMIVLGAATKYINMSVQRGQAEQTKVDLNQQARAFVDEFQRDVHQAGYPGCKMFNFAGNCTAHYTSSTMAVGLVSVSNTQIVFEGDVDGDGVVDSIWYRLVDSAGNYPPTGTCPCTIQRGVVVNGGVIGKVNGVAPLAQVPTFSQELENVVNSGVPGAGNVYGNGLQISGTTLFAGGSYTNTAYYAAVTTFKDFPVFSVYDQNGAAVSSLPADITTPAGQAALASIKTIRLTINLLGSGTTGYDMQNGVRPVVTLVGDSRINN